MDAGGGGGARGGVKAVVTVMRGRRGRGLDGWKNTDGSCSLADRDACTGYAVVQGQGSSRLGCGVSLACAWPTEKFRPRATINNQAARISHVSLPLPPPHPHPYSLRFAFPER